MAIFLASKTERGVETLTLFGPETCGTREPRSRESVFE
jgi:hypothetical protein